MQRRGSVTRAALVAIREFIMENRRRLASLNLDGLVMCVDGMLSELDACAARETPLSREVMRRVQDCRDALLREMRAAAAAARFVLDAEVVRKLRLPHGYISVKRLVPSSAVMVQALREHEGALAAATGLGENFVARLERSTAELEAAIAARCSDQQRVSSAELASINTARRGRELIRMINALVVPVIRDDPLLGVRWEMAKAKGGSGEVVMAASA